MRLQTWNPFMLVDLNIPTNQTNDQILVNPHITLLIPTSYKLRGDVTLIKSSLRFRKMWSGRTDGQPKPRNPAAKPKGSLRYFVQTSLSDTYTWQCDDNSEINCEEEVRRPDMSVNRLNCCATSPDYFLALIFCLPSATDLNKSIRGFRSPKYATKILPLFAVVTAH